MNFLKVYTTPLQRPNIKFYIGRRRVGTPIFYPRKRIGFKSWDLGYKTKWTSDDYRFEWDPGFSFVFFDFQIAVAFTHDHPSHYWEGFLYYHFDTEGSVEDRLKWAIKGFPMIYYRSDKSGKYYVSYWDKIVKRKYKEFVKDEIRIQYSKRIERTNEYIKRHESNT